MDGFVDLVLIMLQFALAGALAAAAVGKALDLAGSRKAVHDFGVPKRWADLLGTALPGVELVLALLLLPGSTARWAALGAGLLFLAFIAGIGVNLYKGRQPDCHCFGQFHSAPAGWPAMVRNAAFALMAAVIVWRGSPGPVDWFSGLTEVGQIAVVIGTVLLALGAAQVWLLLQIWRQNSALLARAGEAQAPILPILGDDAVADTSIEVRPAPAFELPTIDGGRLSLDELRASGKSVLLLFVDPGCGPCRQLVPDIHEWNRRFAEEFTVALISRGTPEENRDKFGDVTLGLQENREVYDAYAIHGTPSGVLIHPDGLIRDPSAPGQGNIRELVVRMMRTLEGRDYGMPAKAKDHDAAFDPKALLRLPEGPDVGTQGTRLPLPDLDGGYVGLDDLRGARTVLLFWGPDCTFCQRMLPELKEWEADPGSADVNVLIVSSGTVEENRELGLRARIVIDNAFTTGGDYGVTGTPSAILLDAEGRVASSLVAGADAVLDLLYEEAETGITPSGTVIQV
jgi:peroxiredoxin